MHIEELPLFLDLLTLALQTDSTRVATFEIPMGFTTSDLDNVTSGYHGLSHHSKGENKLEQLKVVEDYIFTQVNRLFDGLQEAKSFDDTLVVMGSGMSDGSKHSNKDLPVLLAGGGLKHGRYLAHDAKNNTPLSNLFVHLLNQMNINTNKFASSTGELTL